MGLNSRGHLCHPEIILIVLSNPRRRGWLVCVSVLGMLRVELVGRPVAELTVLLPVTVVWIGSGFHWDIGGEVIRGFVDAVVAGSVVLLGFAV
jgi:hypothetical protein